MPTSWIETQKITQCLNCPVSQEYIKRSPTCSRSFPVEGWQNQHTRKFLGNAVWHILTLFSLPMLWFVTLQSRSQLPIFQTRQFSFNFLQEEENTHQNSSHIHMILEMTSASRVQLMLCWLRTHAEHIFFKSRSTCLCPSVPCSRGTFFLSSVRIPLIIKELLGADYLSITAQTRSSGTASHSVAAACIYCKLLWGAQHLWDSTSTCRTAEAERFQ